MNLINSVITSFIIVVALWGAALMQLPVANAIEHKDIKKNIANEDAKANKVTANALAIEDVQNIIHISGLQQQIMLKNVDQIWQTFSTMSALNQSLKQQPKKVYVLYGSFSKNYQKANVTIGYDINELTKFDRHYSVNISEFKPLLPAKHFEDGQLAKAWDKIDYNKKVNAVLEIHTLAKSGKPQSTQILVSYK